MKESVDFLPNSPCEVVVSLVYVTTLHLDPVLVLELPLDPKDLCDLWDFGESGTLCLG